MGKKYAKSFSIDNETQELIEKIKESKKNEDIEFSDSDILRKSIKTYYNSLTKINNT